MTVKTPKNNIRYIFTKYIRTIVIFFVVSVTGNIYVSAQMLHASITVSDTTEQNLTPISPLMYGGFIEYLDDDIIGRHALAAQELANRGFDIRDSKTTTLQSQWTSWKSSTDVIGEYYVKPGGSNKKGNYFEQLETKSVGKFGIAQEVQLPSKVGSEAYIYCRSDSYQGELFASLVSLSGQEVYSIASLGKCSDKWQKKTAKFPPLNGIYLCQLIFYIDTIGIIELDEASFLPDDHFFGVRREHLDLYNSWKPSSLRFMGGCFSDQPVGKWENAIGDIDQRPSPNLDWLSQPQRVEIGVDQFMAFCNEIGAEAQLTVGFGNGTPEDAAAWVEYCNGDTLSKYGSLRAKNGHPLPYKVKYWEVGNEQYGDWEVGHTTAVIYAQKYIDFCKSMKKVDSSIKILINGDLWGFKWNDTIIKIARDYIDLFSLHSGMGYEITSSYSKDSVYRILAFNPFFYNYWLNAIEDALQKSGLKASSKLAITEWIQFYGSLSKTHDPNNASLQSGLWNAQTFNVMLSHAKSIEIINKTIYQGVIQSGVNSTTGERIIFGDPIYHIINLFHSKLRKNVITSKIQSPTYDYDIWKNTPWLNAAITYSEDTLVGSIVNPHPTDSMEVALLLPFNLINKVITLTQIYSRDYTDSNVPDFPNRIVPVTWKQTFTGIVKLPPHSFLLVSMPLHGATRVEPPPGINQYNIEVQPNPAESHINIVFDIPTLSEIGFEIFNSIGEKIHTISPIYYTKGHISIPVQTSLLPIGSYYCKAILHSEVITKKFIIAR